MKKFMCYWNPAVYSGDYGIRTENEEFFSEDNGYSEDDIAQINGLQIGGTVCFDQGDHIVTRIS